MRQKIKKRSEKIMDLNPASIARKIITKAGLHPKSTLLATGLTTAVLEFGTQALENHAPDIAGWKGLASKTITNQAPFLGNVDVRDAVVLSPSIGQGARLLRGKGRPNFKIIAVNYGMKAVFRRLGLNRLPDEKKPAQSARKVFSYQLPART